MNSRHYAGLRRVLVQCSCSSPGDLRTGERVVAEPPITVVARSETLGKCDASTDRASITQSAKNEVQQHRQYNRGKYRKEDHHETAGTTTEGSNLHVRRLDRLTVHSVWSAATGLLG